MKNLTFIAIAVLSATTTFAQPGTVKIFSENQVIVKSSFKSENSSYSDKATLNSSDKISAKANNAGTGKVFFTANLTANEGISGTYHEPEAGLKEKKKFKLFKDKKEETGNNGEAISGLAQETSLTVKSKVNSSADYTSEKSIEVSEKVKLQTEATAGSSSDNTVALTDDKIYTPTDVIAQGKEKKKKKSKDVKEVTQETEATGNDKGQEVKEVATSKRNNKPAEVNADAAVNADGAARVKSAGRPQRPGAVVKVASSTGAAASAKPVKVIKPVGANRPVKVGSAARGVLKIK